MFALVGKYIATGAFGIAVFTLVPAVATASSIGFAGLWSESDASAEPLSNTLSFDSTTTLFSDGIFAGYEAANVNPLEFSAISTTNDGVTALTRYGLASGYDGSAWKTYENEAGDVITFDLDLDATWVRTFDIADGDVNYEQGSNADGVFEYTGIYTFGDGSSFFGRGQLNASSDEEARVYEVTQAVNVIPLPGTAWLLIGAIGGLGVMRRRNAAN